MLVRVTPIEVAPPLSPRQVGAHGGAMTNPPNCRPLTQWLVSPAAGPPCAGPTTAPWCDGPPADVPPAAVPWVAAAPGSPVPPSESAPPAVPGTLTASGGGTAVGAGAVDGKASASTSWTTASGRRGE